LPPLTDFNIERHFGGTDTVDLIVQADDITDPDTSLDGWVLHVLKVPVRHMVET
jgi:hypothetical protein